MRIASAETNIESDYPAEPSPLVTYRTLFPAPSARDDKMWQPAEIMQRASKLIRRLGLSGDTITVEQLACAAWPNAVGAKVADHTRAARMVRTRLIVEVEDAVW